MKAPLPLLIAAILLATAPHVSGAETIDKEHGFTLSLPDGFVAEPRMKVDRETIHAFALSDNDDETVGVYLIIKLLPGVLDRSRIKEEDLPPGRNVKLIPAKWKDFDVNAFEVRELLQLPDGEEIPAANYNVQIPLKKAAIQITLFGPAEREEELKRFLDQILGGLKGESNWISSALPIDSEAYGTILMVAGGIALICGFVALYVASKVLSNVTFLIGCCVIYAASREIGVFPIREAKLLSGVLSLIGFAGIALGIWDSIRGKKIALPKPVEQTKTEQVAEPTPTEPSPDTPDA